MSLVPFGRWRGGLSKELKTLGDHIRKRRLELGFQKDAAKQIGVDEATIFNWESNETTPTIRHIPRVIEFLGYNPLPPPESLIPYGTLGSGTLD